MELYCRGICTVVHHDTSLAFEISSDEVDWEVVSSSERQMGPETQYEASIDHPELGELKWSLWEYPSGIENFRETDVGPHRLIRDFEYGLEASAPEPDNTSQKQRYYSEDDSEFGLSSEELSRLSPDEQVPYLVHWFRKYYWDPAQETPYNGREGGYQYIHGGPYNANDEIREEFEPTVSEDAILLAIDEVEADGIYDWAPSPQHSDQEASRDEAFEDEPEDVLRRAELRIITARLEGGFRPIFGSSEELQQRQKLAGEVKALREIIEQYVPQPIGMGHNQPPEDMRIEPEDREVLTEAVGAMDSELAASTPDAVLVAAQATKLQRVLKYGAEKADQLVTEFIKGFAGTFGKATAVVLATGGFDWSPIWDGIITVFNSAVTWLSTITWPF